ncbi:60S ribosomal subunit assembly or modification protein [Dimargaris verticillata]|uniref:60S ribosomal subunit assembly or modification protein n=1 Tax=Dimargaris verticillata TaxID=2761393 RepID=A0A9W8B6E7_9FUNG|nr:60S ribosomal subunit assembly or modification protein [Dimargaris verticillata]
MSNHEESDSEFIRQDEVGETVDTHYDMDLSPSDDSADEDMGPDTSAAAVPGEDMDPMANFEDDSVQGFFEHHEPVYTVDMHPVNELLLISGGGDDKAYLWRRDTGEQLAELTGFDDSVTSVGFSVTGDLMAAADMRGKVQVWNTDAVQASTAPLASLDGPDEVLWLDWHPRGNILLAGSADGTMWMWMLPLGKCMNVFSGHSMAVTCGQFTRDGKTIVTGCEDGSLVIWDPKTAAANHRLDGHDARFHSETITCLDTNADSTLVLTGSTDHTARLVHLQNGNIVGSLGNHAESIETVGFSPTTTLAATGSVDGTVNIWDIKTLKHRGTLRHEDAVTKLQWHADSPLLTTTSVDTTVKVWDARTGNCEHTWRGHQNTVLDFAMSRDGRTIVSGSDDGCCLVFSA